MLTSAIFPQIEIQSEKQTENVLKLLIISFKGISTNN